MRYTDFFRQDTEDLAKALLGKLLLIKRGSDIMGGYIVETEAYLGVIDKACHGFGGNKTPKVQALYAEAGTIYVYTIHTHKLLNIVAREKGNPQAVLIRAIEPAVGISLMEKNRNTVGISLTNGPGKFTKAMGITSEHNMTKIQEGELYIDFKNSKLPKKIKKSPRIGIPDKDIWTEKALRFFVVGNQYVSGMRKTDYDKFPWKED